MKLLNPRLQPVVDLLKEIYQSCEEEGLNIRGDNSVEKRGIGEVHKQEDSVLMEE